MKNFIMLLMATGIIMSSCNSGDTKKKMVDNNNPFFSEYKTPFGVPPFEQIKPEHYMPAFIEGMKQQKAEIKAITDNKEAPTFANTVEAFEKTGALLDKAGLVFYNVSAAESNDELRKIEKELAPLTTKHAADISLNEALFSRIKAVYNKKNELKLSDEQKILLDKQFKSFVRNGANLPEVKKAKLRKINEKLAMLYIKYNENILEETKNFKMVLDKKEDLAGLPKDVIAAAAETAENAGMKGKWMFTVQKPSMFPFLTYSTRRDLREKIFKGYINRGDNNNKNDNKSVAKEITELRIKRAKLFGYKNFAEQALEKNMAKTPEKVLELLKKVMKAATPVAKQEVKDMQAIIKKEGKNFKLQPWDWMHYSEKVKKAKFAFDESSIKPYFELNNVVEGAFYCATKLWGITFTKLENIPVYHKECDVYEVKDKDGKHVGILYCDWHPRSGRKTVGAWMTAYRKQSENVAPVISLTCNFTRPTKDTPALLSWDEVTTLFHEFGHGLHGLLSQCKYNSLSGTSVARDYVELPSQIMENWAAEPEVLKVYAKHYKTGEVIPNELVKKFQKAATFNQGFVTAEYTSAALLDFAWHMLEELPANFDVNKFETEKLKEIGLIDEIIVRYRSTYFKHIFGSEGYASGYYVYMWAAILDADAFAYFKANDIFDQKIAKSFLDNVLSKGGTEDEMTAFKRFRGQEPTVDALLKRKGLLN